MKNWKGLIGVVAPTLARALGGPVGAIAGTAIKVLSTALGVEPNEDALEAKLTSLSSEELLALKQADQKFALEMKRLEIDVARLDAEDRASARDMQKTTRSWVPATLAIVIHFLLAGMIVALFTHTVPEPNRTAFDILLGIVGTGTASVWGFYFGSSQSSRQKDEALGHAIRSSR